LEANLGIAMVYERQFYARINDKLDIPITDSGRYYYLLSWGKSSFILNDMFIFGRRYTNQNIMPTRRTPPTTFPRIMGIRQNNYFFAPRPPPLQLHIELSHISSVIR
jgi:hypothetical protein|tara:strand:+ start:203 stop:523 length:321 start_codon:yes stop_codon:yes gene_type:complete